MTVESSLTRFLKTIKTIAESIHRQIQYLPSGNLFFYNQIKNGKTYTLYYTVENGKKKYITKNRSLIEKLALKYFLTEQAFCVDECIDALNLAVHAAHQIQNDSVLKNIPEEIRLLLENDYRTNCFFDFCNKENEDDLEWRNQEYVKSSNYPQHLRHRTSSGEMVRSKSEVIIYELLQKHDLAFRYEREKFIDGYVIHPDFEIRRKDGKIIYWEHCGLMDSQKYIDSFHWKLNHFEKEGIVLWDNLILTFDDSFGNIDVNIIEAEIQNKLL